MEFKNQKEMFEWIWGNRPHVSEISGQPLLPKTDWQWHWQFGHLLSKGTFPSYKLREENIMLMTVKEHENQERHAMFNERREEIQIKYYNENKFKNSKTFIHNVHLIDNYSK